MSSERQIEVTVTSPPIRPPNLSEPFYCEAPYSGLDVCYLGIEPRPLDRPDHSETIMSEIDTTKYDYYWYDTKIKKVKVKGDDVTFYYDVTETYQSTIKKSEFSQFGSIVRKRKKQTWPLDHSESSDESDDESLDEK